MAQNWQVAMDVQKYISTHRHVCIYIQILETEPNPNTTPTTKEKITNKFKKIVCPPAVILIQSPRVKCSNSWVLVITARKSHQWFDEKH